MKIFHITSAKKWNKCLCFTRYFEAKQMYLRCYGTTHYDTLGVNSQSSQTEIKDAYLKLSKKFHPDVNQNDPKSHEKFVKIQAAYGVLGNPSKRNDYDVDLHVGRTYQENMKYNVNRQRQSNYYSRPYDDETFFHHAHGKIPDEDERQYNFFIRIFLFTAVQILLAVCVIIASSGRRGIGSGDRELHMKRISEFMQRQHPHSQLKLDSAIQNKDSIQVKRTEVPNQR